MKGPDANPVLGVLTILGVSLLALAVATVVLVMVAHTTEAFFGGWPWPIKDAPNLVLGSFFVAAGGGMMLIPYLAEMAE